MILIFVSLLQSRRAIVNVVIWLDDAERNCLFTLHVRWIHTDTSLIHSADPPAKDARKLLHYPMGYSDLMVHVCSQPLSNADGMTI